MYLNIAAHIFFTGRYGLKDTFASLRGPYYDLRAPDYSYLAIVELRSFYQTKSSLFIECKDIATKAQSLLQDLVLSFENHGDKICNAIQSIKDRSINIRYTHLCNFTEHLRRISVQIITELPNIG